MIKKTENCIYCGEKMESITAKKKFCCDLHRVYWNRERVALLKLESEEEQNVSVRSFQEPTNKVEPLKTKGGKKSNYTIDTTEKKKMPDGLDKFQKLRWLRENS